MAKYIDFCTIMIKPFYEYFHDKKNISNSHYCNWVKKNVITVIQWLSRHNFYFNSEKYNSLKCLLRILQVIKLAFPPYINKKREIFHIIRGNIVFPIFFFWIWVDILLPRQCLWDSALFPFLIYHNFNMPCFTVWRSHFSQTPLLLSGPVW